jgi:hypothetical protein
LGYFWRFVQLFGQVSNIDGKRRKSKKSKFEKKQKLSTRLIE